MNHVPAHPTVLHPLADHPRVVLLKPLLTSPLIEVGEFSYFVIADVPAYGVVGGNPARLIRSRHNAEDVTRLLAVAWWDWPTAYITEHLRLIMSGTIDDLERVAPA